MSNDNTATNPTPTDTAEKRTRTSPRSKMLFEVMDMLDAYKVDVEAQKTEAVAEGEEAKSYNAILSTVSDIRGRVEAMVGGQIQKPVYGGRWYIGRKNDGSHDAFQANSPPTRLKFGSMYSAVFGPCRTESGAVYRTEHPEMLAEIPALFQ